MKGVQNYLRVGGVLFKTGYTGSEPYIRIPAFVSHCYEECVIALGCVGSEMNKWKGGYHSSSPMSSRCDSQASSFGIIWQLGRNANYWAPLQTILNQKLWMGPRNMFNKTPRWFCCMLKFENHCSSQSLQILSPSLADHSSPNLPVMSETINHLLLLKYLILQFFWLLLSFISPSVSLFPLLFHKMWTYAQWSAICPYIPPSPFLSLHPQSWLQWSFLCWCSLTLKLSMTK